MVQDLLWKADIFLAVQELPPFLIGPYFESVRLSLSFRILFIAYFPYFEKIE
jgi:hypothetical protein